MKFQVNPSSDADDKASVIFLFLSVGLLVVGLFLPAAEIGPKAPEAWPRGVIAGYQCLFFSMIYFLFLFNTGAGKYGMLIVLSNISFFLQASIVPPQLKKYFVMGSLFCLALPVFCLNFLFRDGLLLKVDLGFYLWYLALLLNTINSFRSLIQSKASNGR